MPLILYESLSDVPVIGEEASLLSVTNLNRENQRDGGKLNVPEQLLLPQPFHRSFQKAFGWHLEAPSDF